MACVLGSLIRIKYPGSPMTPQRSFKGGCAEFTDHGNRKLPGKDISAVSVHDGRQIDKTAGKPDICQIRTPRLIRPVNINIPQKIRVDLILRVSLAGIRFWCNGLNSHFAHQPLNPLTVDFIPLTS